MTHSSNSTLQQLSQHWSWVHMARGADTWKDHVVYDHMLVKKL